MSAGEQRGSAAVEALERDLGARVRQARRAERLTQQQLADRANVSVGTVKNLEAGAGSSITTLVRVLRALSREDWIAKLYVEPPAFNPFDLLPADRKRPR